MQLFELVPFFQRLQGVAFQHSSETQYLFSQRLVAWVCLTFFSKAITCDMLYLFLQRLFPRCCLFLQKVRGPFLSKPELPLQSHCRQPPPAFGSSCGPHAMWQLASPTGPSYKPPKGLMSCHQSQCQCLFSRHTPPFHLPHTFPCRNVLHQSSLAAFSATPSPSCSLFHLQNETRWFSKPAACRSHKAAMWLSGTLS